MINTWAFKLAETHLAALPHPLIVDMSPPSYGSEVTDDHRTYVWDFLVDYYKHLPPVTLYQAYTEYVVDKAPFPAFKHQEMLDAKEFALRITRELDRMLNPDIAPWED